MATFTARIHVLVGAFLASAFLLLSGCDCGAVALPGSTGGGTGTGGGAPTGGGVGTQGGGAGNQGGGMAGQGGGDQGGTGGGGDVDAGHLPDGGCPVFDCTGKCGPVRDFCSGATVACGGCASGVCNLVTNTCGPVQVTCASLGAECGVTKNSCGRRISCPDDGGTSACAAGLECDRNTNRCVPCSNPSPGDLGYQCGQVWLGCGPYTNLTDAGTCANGFTCNLAINICEPQCTPGLPGAICASHGAECGFITDGCGGTVNCGGCAPGTSCGARGVPNQCDPPEYPNECLAANRNCGSFTSACGGPTLDCGSCTVPGEVCNPNGRCGPPCSPTTCAGDLNGHCGAQLDAGCGVLLDCGCTNTSLVCTSPDAGVVGDCKTPAACGQFTTGGEDAGCSDVPSSTFGGLSCPCSGTGLCKSGVCCVNHAQCPLNACATSVPNSCTGEAIPCTCTTPGTFCDAPADGGVGTCANYRTCSYYTNQLADAGCSNTTDPVDFPRYPGDPVGNKCPCLGGNGINCYRDGGVVATGGVCCQNTATCNIQNGGGVGSECNTTKNNTCTDAGVTCACTQAGTHCNNLTHLCEVDNGCSKYTDGAPGSVCSTGADPDFPSGSGTNLTCTCTTLNANCYTDAGVQLPIGSSTTGHCCVPDQCPANACGTTITDHCTGQVKHCDACTAAGNGTVHCDSASHTCVNDLKCSDYNANGNGAVPPAQGDVCSNGPAFSNGATPPTNFSCPCNNNDVTEVCVNGTTRVSGTTTGNCCINTVTCGGGTTGASCNTTLKNACTGADISCGQCNTGYYCDNTNHCQQNLTCSNDSSGWTGQNGSVCSTSANTAFPRYFSPPAPAADTTGQTCNCTGGRECSVASGTPNPHLAGVGEVGSCCTNTNTCGTGVGAKCNQTVTDNCTSATSSCPACNSSTQYCSLPDAGLATGGGNPGTCRTDPTNTCSAWTTRTPGTPAGTRGTACSNANSSTFPRYPGDTTGQTCQCTSGGCYDADGGVVTGGTTGLCCTPVQCAPNQCGNSVYDPCTKKTIQCPTTCGTGQYCKANVCTAYETCATYTTQTLDAGCSRGPDPNWPKGDGTNLTCNCTTSGAVCVKPLPGPQVPTDGTEGTCCKNTAGPATNSCGSYIDTCTGVSTPYSNCNTGFHCPASGNGACIADTSCATYTTQANGQPCSNGATSAFHDGPGGTNLTCQCSTAGGYSNITCVGWNATTAGTCQCTPSTPANCGDNGKSNGCGGSMVSTCTPGTQVCYSNACCTLPVCKSGFVGDPCGTITQCGSMTNCGACATTYPDAGVYTRNTCSNNVCTCTPYTLADCPVLGQGIKDDGCGGQINCKS